MSTYKSSALGLLLVTAFGAAALEVPRAPAENESVPQAPIKRAHAAGLPPSSSTDLNFFGASRRDDLDLRGPPVPVATAFRELDLDRDGSISPLEAGDDLTGGFAHWDSDGSGKLSRAEFDRYRSERAALARGRTESGTLDRY